MRWCRLLPLGALLLARLAAADDLPRLESEPAVEPPFWVTHEIVASEVTLSAMLHARGWRLLPAGCSRLTLCEANGARPGVRIYGQRRGRAGPRQIAYVWPQASLAAARPSWGICVADADLLTQDAQVRLCADARDDFTDDVQSGLALVQQLRGAFDLPLLKVELRHGAGELAGYLQKAAEPSGPVAGRRCESSMPPIVPLQRNLLDTVIWRDNGGDKLIALTFDACSTFHHGRYNPAVIEHLRRLQVPATLFIGGHWAEMHPSELQALAAEPLFEIGNHTYSHPHMITLSPARQREELLWTQFLIYRLTGQVPRLYRPPYGEITDQMIYEAAQLGLYTVEYDLPAGDADIHVSARRLIGWVLSRATSGSIVIMHMNHPESKTAEILSEIVTRLRARGYRFAKVSDLLRQMDAARLRREEP